MSGAEFDELIDPREGGRVFVREGLRPGLADAAPGGRVRLDALARWIQDVAHADVLDAGLGGRALWVVRRARLAVERFPRFDEHVTLRTFSSGLGRLWAERRTTIETDGGGRVESVALWVHLDPETGRPVPLSAEERELYLAANGGREVRARLRHPPPPEDAAARPWRFRASELDLAGHVNNAAYWAPLEEELLAGPEPGAFDAEIEYRTPAQPGELRLLADGARRWLAGSEVHASIAIA